METDKAPNPWIPFQEVDFDNVNLLQYHIDTRDFHCSTNEDSLLTLGNKINWDKINQYSERFYFTKDEVVSFLLRIYNESGGRGTWRMFELDIPKRNYWELKYIRIYRLPNNEFLICSKDSYALKKEILEAPVVTEYLNFMDESKEP